MALQIHVDPQTRFSEKPSGAVRSRPPPCRSGRGAPLEGGEAGAPYRVPRVASAAISVAGVSCT